MTSLPLLSSRDGVEIVAALLGHSRRSATNCDKVATLDCMFDEIIDNLRHSLPRAHIESGSTAVTSLLQALHDVNMPVQRKKRYHQPVPSTHCHVCCRPNSNVEMKVCANIRDGTCRKVVCSRCIEMNGWCWDTIRTLNTWTCPHCKDNCANLSRAQCWVYKRTNLRRKKNNIYKKQRQARTSPRPNRDVD